ncbi:hypothetical protein GCM10011529_02930 [Polymorphobacter glacialis]|uniref:DUF308 domain-containing protein n=1 Tax=Sandarakinorhabdus glacialis TaxID=1614636 RepID=A0A916ZJ48_9SPHN|nr:hypothetical protein [Polymorphobacter glacialis]GGE00156.1 hypothetical protein GCM10011529_02930 [Polymorphobacter glacialis]
MAMNRAMDWKTQAGLAAILGILGLSIMLNPVTIVSAAGSLIPWLLLIGAAIQFVSILLRSRRRFRIVIGPALIGILLAYAGLSMKFGDPTTIGPVSLIFVLGLLLIGSAGAKLMIAVNAKQSKYFHFILAAAILSAVLGAVMFFNWSEVSVALIGVFIGLELIADAVAMAALALRDRDGEEALEARGLDPVAEAAMAAAISAAATATPAAPAETPQPLSPSIAVMQEAQVPDIETSSAPEVPPVTASKPVPMTASKPASPPRARAPAKPKPAVGKPS